MRLHLHAPNRTLWIIAAVLFIVGLFWGVAMILSAALLLLGTSVL
jgi:hypothetical protein